MIFGLKYRRNLVDSNNIKVIDRELVDSIIDMMIVCYQIEQGAII